MQKGSAKKQQKQPKVAAQAPQRKMHKKAAPKAAKKVVKKVTKKSPISTSSASMTTSAVNFASIKQSATFQPQKAFRQTTKTFSDETKKIKDYFEISIASPNAAPYQKAPAYAVYISTQRGEKGLLRNAAAGIYTLKPGTLRVYEEQGGKPKSWFVPTGVARVAFEDKSLSVTCSEMIPLEELDIEVARKVEAGAIAAIASATDPIEKGKHTVTQRVAASVVKQLERFKASV